MDQRGSSEGQDPASSGGIAVALSGGGHRATLFALGALLYLADSGKTRAVRSVASVSGGSLANGVVAQSVDLTSAGAGELGAVASKTAGQITGRGTLFGTRWTVAYMLLTVAVGLGAAIAPWFLPIPVCAQITIVVLGVALAIWLVGQRSRVCAFAYDRTLFRPGGESTRLGTIHRGVDHVFCATELHAGENVYFSGGFVYSYRFGIGEPGDVRLSTVVQASAAFPGAFPPAWLPTAPHRFAHNAQREAASTREMALVDGGVYDNMGDQWGQGISERAKRPGCAGRFREAEELVVVNASAGFEWGALGKLRLPALGELLSLMRDKSVLYDNGNSVRRRELVGRFIQADKLGEGLRGALVHIAQSPYRVAKDFADDGDARGARAQAALAALRASEGGDGEARWEQVAVDNSAVATTLVSFDVETASKLLHHAYLLAMANLHVLRGYPLLEVPAASRFDAIAAGRPDPGAAGGAAPPPERR